MADTMDIRELVEAAAIELVYRNNQDEIVRLLVESGATPEIAARLVMLIPSAFARERFEPEGISFPDNFLSGPKGHFVSRPYSAEPIYSEARSLAQKWILESRACLVERILDWSVEADLIKKAKAQGGRAKSISEVHQGF